MRARQRRKTTRSAKSESSPTRSTTAAFGKEPKRKPAQIDFKRAQQIRRGRDATSPFAIPWLGWKDILWRTYQQIEEDRLLAIAGGVVFFGLLAMFPAIAAFVSLYGLFADLGTINNHIELAAGLLPVSTLDIIREQVTRIVTNADTTLGFAFISGLLIALWSANAGMKAIIDALNVIYGEREKRGFVTLTLVALRVHARHHLLHAGGGRSGDRASDRFQHDRPRRLFRSLAARRCDGRLYWPFSSSASPCSIAMGRAAMSRAGNGSASAAPWRRLSGWQVPCCCPGISRNSPITTRLMDH